MERIEDISSNASVGGQGYADAKYSQLELGMKRQVTVEMRRSPTDHRIGLDPRFQSSTDRSKGPAPIIADPGTQGELVGIQHEIAGSLEEREEFGANTLLARLF